MMMRVPKEPDSPGRKNTQEEDQAPGQVLKQTYFHKAYGMRFRSEIPDLKIPPGIERTFDVDIVLGPVPDTLEDPKICGYKFQARPSQVLLQTFFIADFYITGGNQIAVQPKEGARPSAIQTLLLGWAMAALLHQRGIFPLHGSVLTSGKEAVIFCGPSGSGKSKIALALTQRGYRLLDDNIAVISLGKNGARVHPGTPEIKMYGKDIPLEMQKKHPVEKLFTGSDKFSIDASPFFFSKPLPVVSFFLLHNSHEKRKIIPLKGHDKIVALHENIFCSRFVNGLEKAKPLFEFLTRLGRCASVFLVQEPRSPDFPASLIETLKEKNLLNP